MSRTEVLKQIRDYIDNDKYLISDHARSRMFQRKVKTYDVSLLFKDAIIVEVYPDDYPCPSYLIKINIGEIYHIVVGLCKELVKIITIYVPDPAKWNDDYTRRLNYE